MSERTVTLLVHRYEELLALRLMDATRLRAKLCERGQVMLAIDALQPDVGHEVLWVLRDVLSGEVLLARALLGSGEEQLVPLFQEVMQALGDDVPVLGVISVGQRSIRNAVQRALPGVPHQLCQFHFLREAARPIYEADRHAKVLPRDHQLETAHSPGVPRGMAVRPSPEVRSPPSRCWWLTVSAP